MSEHEEHHIVGPKTYLANMGLLGVLLVLTVGAAYADFGGTANLIIALVIAFSKAFAILAIFMHLKYSSSLTRLCAVCGFLWMGILFAFTMQDFLSRHLIGLIDLPF